MSANPWWKKEISVRRRARGTVVVAKPMLPPGLVEKAAAIFELPPEPMVPSPAPSIRPGEPATSVERDHLDARTAPLPPVWPRTLELVPGPEPEPEPEPEPDLPPAAYLPVPAVPAFSLPPLEPVELVPPEPEPTPEPEPEPVARKPLLKRELRLPRRKKHPAKTARVKAKRPKQSIWERNVKLPRLRRPDAPVKLVGLRVGSTQLAAAHVSNNGSIELLQLARTPLRPGLVVGGEVREPDGLASELKEFFARHKLPRKNVRLGIASNRIGVRVLELPVIDDPRAFANAIRFRAQELLPIPVTDAVLDHVVLGEHMVEGEAMCRVLLAFAHRDLVARYADACQKAGVKLTGIDLDAFALLRSVSEPRSEEAEATQAVVAVAIGHERTVFAVSDGLICDFVRVLEWGGGALDAALAHSLDLTPDRAHEAKHQLVLADGGTAPDGLGPVQVEAARVAVRDELRVLSQEIVSSLRFYQTRPGSLAIGEILVTGGGAELPGLGEELERLVGVPVRAADPLVRVKLGKKVKRPAEAGSYAVAIGLGIEG